MNNVVFKAPAKLGDIITFYGQTTKIGKTSITIQIKAEKMEVSCQNNYSSKFEKKLIECEIIFVKVDNFGKPVNF